MAPAREPSGLDMAGLQRWFLERVVAPHRRSGAAPPLPGPTAQAVIVPSRTLSSEQRLAIYSGMYMIRLREVMAQQYPVVARLVGKGDFAELVRGYLERHPPHSYTTHVLGQAFPSYLACQTQRADTGLLHDVARLERAMGDALDAPDTGTVTAETLASVPAERWGEVRFRMNPSLHIMAFEHDACGIVSAHKADRALPDSGPRRTWAAVWRKELTVWRQPLTAPTYAALSALAAGHAVGDALEQAAAAWDGDHTELATRVFQWFSDWVSEEYFAAIVRPPAPAIS